jgi:hypothetical protein
MTTNCTRAKRDIALWVGSDLDDQEVAALRRHLACCECCREHWRQMKRSLQSLQEPGEFEPAERAESVWPALAGRLPSREAFRRADEFNGWLPATVVAAACLAVLVFVRSGPPTHRRSLEQQGLQLGGGGYSAPVFRVDGPPRDVRLRHERSDLYGPFPPREPSVVFPVPRRQSDDWMRRLIEPPQFELRLQDR